jgi:chromosome segregation ATPase
MMVEEDTKDIPDGRSFEERVFARFDAIDAWRDSTDRRFESIDRRFENIDRRFANVDRRLDGIESRLESLEIASEKRALETKPIWERALAEILEMKNGLAELSRKIDVLSREILTVKADQLRLDDRLDRIESKPS